MTPNTNLIRLFDFYLALMFAIGLWRRRRMYIDTARLTWNTLGHRRKLINRLGQHKGALLQLNVILPFVLVAGLTILQWVSSRLIWPQALLTVEQVITTWRWIVLLAIFVPMVGVDVYFLINVGKFDRGETEKYLDYAENWLGWRAPIVSVLTLGIVRPRKIVDAEVRKSLETLGKSASWAMWWTSVQSTLRVSFGLCIWLLWATSGSP